MCPLQLYVNNVHLGAFPSSVQSTLAYQTLALGEALIGEDLDMPNRIVCALIFEFVRVHI